MGALLPSAGPAPLVAALAALPRPRPLPLPRPRPGLAPLAAAPALPVRGAGPMGAARVPADPGTGGSDRAPPPLLKGARG